MKRPTARLLVMALVASALSLWLLHESAPSAPGRAGSPDAAPLESSPSGPVIAVTGPAASAPAISPKRSPPKFVALPAPPAAVSPAPAAVSPAPPVPGQVSGGSAPPDIYTALGLSAAETQHARDVLQIQRQRVIELGQGLREKKVDLAQFRVQMRELGQETDDNLRVVLGEEKLAAWRAYREQHAPALPAR